jgi:hypothetical protein
MRPRRLSPASAHSVAVPAELTLATEQGLVTIQRHLDSYLYRRLSPVAVFILLHVFMYGDAGWRSDSQGSQADLSALTTYILLIRIQAVG